MQTWWDSSPYYDYGFYLKGAASHQTNPGLTSQWITGVTAQGWGLIPIWAGPQPPCACYVGGPYPNCTPFPHTFSATPTEAFTQGETEGADARASMQSIGLSGGIAYLDIEPYDSTACGNAVQQFVSGWVTELHSLGAKAGLYGNEQDELPDFTNISPMPDDLWIADYDHARTVWNLGWNQKEDLPNSDWSTHQRMKQYWGPTTQSWGGVAMSVDRDIEDATIYKPQGQKLFGFGSPSLTISDPQAQSTFAWAIADESNTSASGPGTTLVAGEIVGGSAPYGEAGFIYDAPSQSFTTLIYPGGNTYDAIPYGINNIGDVTGSYGDTDNGATYGFIYNSSTQTYTQINVPGSAGTYPESINDAGWVTGEYQDSSDNFHCFLYENGTYTTFDAPAGAGTFCFSINGIGEILGSDTNDSTFIDDAQGNPAGSAANFEYPTLPSDFSPNAINNDNQLEGGASNGSYVIIDNQVIPFLGPANSMNDDPQLVGLGTDSSTNSTVGYVTDPM